MFGYLLFLSSLLHRMNRQEAKMKQVHLSSCFPAYCLSGTARQDTHASSFLDFYRAVQIVTLITNPAGKNFSYRIKIILIGKKLAERQINFWWIRSQHLHNYDFVGIERETRYSR